MIMELVTGTVSDKVFCLSSDEFVGDDVCASISYLSECRLTDFYYFYYFVLFSFLLYFALYCVWVLQVGFTTVL